MKANELMIGDWVNSTIEGNGKVTRIDRDGFIAITYGNQQNAVVCKSYDLQPIPLTDEILKANGYNYNDSLAEWATDSFCVEFGHKAFKEEPDHFFVWVSNCEVALNYVHELQHALKLCKIDKEIVL